SASVAGSVAERASVPPALRDQDLLEPLELLHALAGAHGDAREGVLGDVHGHPGLVTETFVEPAEEGTAAGQDDAAVHDVAGQLARGLVERRTDSLERT